MNAGAGALAVASGPRAAHDAAGAVDRGARRPLRQGRVSALDDHRPVAHRSADEPGLAGKRRRRALADDVEGLAAVLLVPGVVVVVVDGLGRLGAEDPEHLPDDMLAAGVRVLAGEPHRRLVAAPGLDRPGGVG